MGIGFGGFAPVGRKHVHRPSYRFVATNEQCSYSGYSYSDAMDSFIDDLEARNTQQEAEDDPKRFYGIRLGTGEVTAYEVAKWQEGNALPLAPVEEKQEVEERDTDLVFDTERNQLLLEVDWDQYQEVTGLEPEDPPDTVTVDRRGYAPDVAEELGEDYMEEQVALFNDEQQYADYADSYIRQSRPIDDMLDTLYEEADETPLLGELELEVQDGLRLACRQIPFLEQVDGQELHEDIASLSQDDIQHSTSLSTLKDKASDEELPLKAYGKKIAAVQVESYGWEHESGEGLVFDTDPVVSIGTSSDVPYEDVHAVEIGKERYDDLSPTPGDHFLDLEPQEWLGPMSYNLFRKEDEDADEVFRAKLDDETTLTAKR